MKNIYKSITKIVALLFVMAVFVAIPGCNDDPDAYKSTDGVPTVSYIRMPDALSSDSLVSHAFMGTTVALIGENMRSVKEVWFNDQQAILNTSLMTPTVIIVTVPNTIPDNVTGRIYLVNSKKDTVKVDFGVDVPAPLLNSMGCEYVEDGGTAVINGNFFLPVDGSDVPEVYFTPNIKATVVSSTLTSITVKVPVGAGVGAVSVKSRYGTTRSKSFIFRDNRGLILDWDNTNANGGWRSGVLSDSDPVVGVSGNYVRFKGDMTAEAGATWNEDAFSFNMWGTANGRPEGDLFDIAPENAVIKFELNVPTAWSSAALQMIFTPWSTNGTNSYLGDGTVARGLWTPWKSTGSYKTNGWVTITLPLKEFKYNHEGAGLNVPGPGNWGGLTFFLWNGGSEANGTDCSPTLCIDNIRVVPAE